ncbi:MAG: hypothetical protein QOE39_1314, partial [Bradyrhizobium sp.]|nr:hypothetical protein [Bradyrhizobium sp.]
VLFSIIRSARLSIAIEAVVVMMVVMVVVTEPRHHDDAGPIPAIAMMMVMVVLRELDIFVRGRDGPRFVDSL